MKTGTMTMEIDGDKYYYSFEKSGSKRGPEQTALTVIPST